MEASLRKLRVQKPLSDCSNTSTATVTDSAAASTQSSTAYSGAIKHQNPTLFASLTKKNDAVPNPRDSTPSTPRVSSSISGTSCFEVSEPSSVYSLRQTARKRKSTGKENVVPSNCPCTPKTWNVGKKTKQDGRNIQSKTDTTPIASTPTRHISLSTSDTINHEVYDPQSVYTRRKNALKRKSGGQENVGASSCPPALQLRNTRDNSNEDGQNSLSKKSKAPCKKLFKQF